MLKKDKILSYQERFEAMEKCHKQLRNKISEDIKIFEQERLTTSRTRTRRRSALLALEKYCAELLEFSSWVEHPVRK